MDSLTVEFVLFDLNVFCELLSEHLVFLSRLVVLLNEMLWF